MNKVYLLFIGRYDDIAYVGTYTTKEEAERQLKILYDMNFMRFSRDSYKNKNMNFKEWVEHHEVMIKEEEIRISAISDLEELREKILFLG